MNLRVRKAAARPVTLPMSARGKLVGSPGSTSNNFRIFVQRQIKKEDPQGCDKHSKAASRVKPITTPI
jgi:hypothetical protein